MTDLLRVLPHFDTSRYAGLIPALEKHGVTTSELLTLEAADIGKRTQLPLLDVKRLCKAIVEALQADLGIPAAQSRVPAAASKGDPEANAGLAATTDAALPSTLRHTPASLSERWETISTLDPVLDEALGGGIPTGYITEITGESGAGKTQFLLSLLLAVQCPAPHGLGRPAIYISTEAPLATQRLSQMLASNPVFASMSRTARQSLLDRIFSIATPDLESQEHILTNQVPVMVERFNVGLVVLDSVAANYRAEFERGTNSSASHGSGGGNQQYGSNMAARSTELVRLGMELRELARRRNLAVVVANQVADRFTTYRSTPASFRPPPRPPRAAAARGTTADESPLATRTRGPAPPLPAVEPSSSVAELLPPRSSLAQADEHEQDRPPPPSRPPPPPYEDRTDAPPALLLDHQQRWFTGWGDDPYGDLALKTPSLGLVWSTQIASRVALFKRPVWGPSRYREDDDDAAAGVQTMRTWRRWMKVVFAPHAPASGDGLDGAVEFAVSMKGLSAVTKETRQKRKGVDRAKEAAGEVPATQEEEEQQQEE